MEDGCPYGHRKRYFGYATVNDADDAPQRTGFRYVYGYCRHPSALTDGLARLKFTLRSYAGCLWISTIRTIFLGICRQVESIARGRSTERKYVILKSLSTYCRDHRGTAAGLYTTSLSRLLFSASSRWSNHG